MATQMTCEERFLLGKRQEESLCEDRIVEGEHFLAVIDGVTAKSAKAYQGRTSGRYAAELVAEAILSLKGDETALSALQAVDRAIAAVYPDGLPAPDERIQACAILYSRARREIWCYGDCNLMINGREILHTKRIDELLSSLRAFAIEVYLAEGGDPQEIYTNDVGRAAILPFLKKQSLFANRAGEFGYPVLEGSGIVEDLLRIYPVSVGDRVVLASDGYPRLFPTLTESEDYLREVLLRDPLAIRENRQTKTVPPSGRSFDDRAYLSFTVS